MADTEVNRSSLAILETLTRDGTPLACMTEQTVAAYLAPQADSFSARMQPEIARAQLATAQYRDCVVAEGLGRYRADRGVFLMSGSNDMVVAALSTCLRS